MTGSIEAWSGGHEPRVALIIVGTYRETEFVLQLLKYLAGPIKYDVYLVLRHVTTSETSRLGAQERDFHLDQLRPYLNDSLFVCELPSIEFEVAAERYLIPVGPTSDPREAGMLSMFHGVFTAITMMKGSMRKYTHVMKTRTDYLPWTAPWLPEMLALHEGSGGRIIVDGSATTPRRYPDRLDIPWQGSISDLFSFSTMEQFLTLWDFPDILGKVWTGIAETALYRAAMLRFVGDEIQSPRRNETFLRKHFLWEPNGTKQSFYMLRFNVLSPELKASILSMLENGKLDASGGNSLIRAAYDFIFGATGPERVGKILNGRVPAREATGFVDACRAASAGATPL